MESDSEAEENEPDSSLKQKFRTSGENSQDSYYKSKTHTDSLENLKTLEKAIKSEKDLSF